MTDAELNRIQCLVDKMDAAAAEAGRTWTDTADLALGERAEYRRLIDKASTEIEEVEAIHAANAANAQAWAMMGGSDDGRIGKHSDAAW
jgi:hypothetical protein